MNLNKRLFSSRPGFDPIPLTEKIRSGLLAFAGILLLGLALRFLSLPDFPLAVPASMAAAAMLLYAAPHAPMAQPWPLLGGNLLSGAIGWACSLSFPDPVLAAACAVGLSVFVMHLANCLHPPGAATAMAMVLGAEPIHRHGWQWAAGNLLANVLLSLLLALAINNLLSRRRYPLRHAAPVPAPAPARGEPGRADIEWALAQMGSVMDVDEDDLLEIYRLAAERARERTV